MLIAHSLAAASLIIRSLRLPCLALPYLVLSPSFFSLCSPTTTLLPVFTRVFGLLFARLRCPRVLSLLAIRQLVPLVWQLILPTTISGHGIVEIPLSSCNPPFYSAFAACLLYLLSAVCCLLSAACSCLLLTCAPKSTFLDNIAPLTVLCQTRPSSDLRLYIELPIYLLIGFISQTVIVAENKECARTLPTSQPSSPPSQSRPSIQST